MTTFTTEDRIVAEKDGSFTVNVEQRSAKWHQMRLGKVTASRVADILAKTKTGPSASRQNYLIELALQRTTGVIQESYSNSAMEWGTQTEPQARVAYEVATHNFVDQVAFVDHPSIEGFGCSPDGLVGKDGLIEIKCPNSPTHWEYFKYNRPPQKYVIQMQAQMACTGAKWCDFVSFDPRMPERSQLLVVNVLRDDEFILYMEAEIKQFLSEVEAEVNLMKGNENGN
jgi:putative phage-type endonuclease